MSILIELKEIEEWSHNLGDICILLLSFTAFCGGYMFTSNNNSKNYFEDLQQFHLLMDFRTSTSCSCLLDFVLLRVLGVGLGCCCVGEKNTQRNEKKRKKSVDTG